MFLKELFSNNKTWHQSGSFSSGGRINFVDPEMRGFYNGKALPFGLSFFVFTSASK